MFDWGDGEYERTAATLEAGALLAVDAARVAEGMGVLDLGCGTGNAAILAARRGAEVLAVDPAERLLGVARERAAREGLTIRTARGDASQIPASDASFDAVLSVFAVIFAPDAERAVAEMLRVVRPGGAVVVTTWVPEGAVAEAGALLMGEMQKLAPPGTREPSFHAWGDPSWVTELFARHDARSTISRESLVFEAASPEAWFDEHGLHHPAWRAMKRSLGPATWDATRASALERLTAGNERETAFRTTSPCLVVRATRAALT